MNGDLCCLYPEILPDKQILCRPDIQPFDQQVQKHELTRSIHRIQSVIDSLKLLEETLKKTVISMRDMAKGANPATPEGQQTIKQVSAEIDEVAPKLKGLADLQKELQRRQEELATSTGKTNREFSAEAKALASTEKSLTSVNKKTETYAKGSLTDLEKQLAKLKKLYKDADPSVRGGMLDGINKLDKDVKKLNSSIGNHQRGVGNYTGAIKDAASNLFSFAAMAGLAAAAIGKIKEAFFSTDQGIGVLKQWSEASKTFFYGVINKHGKEDIKVASAMAAELNKIRIEDRKDLLYTTKLENEIAILRYKSADATLTETEQLKYLSQAQAKENELIEFKKKDIIEEIQALEKLWMTRKEDGALLDQINAKRVEFENLEGGRNLRLQSRASAIREKEKKANEEKLKEEQSLTEKIMQGANMMTLAKVDSFNKIEIETEKIRNDELMQNDAFYNEQKKQIDAMTEYEIASKKRAEEEKRAIIDQSFQVISGSLNSLSSLYEANKQRELSAAGDNAVAREKIERNYAKKQQALSISQAIINTAMAIIEIWRKWAAFPVIAAIYTGIATAQMGLQLAVIKSQKFAEGGDILGKSHSQGGTMVEAERGEYIVKKQSTSKYHDLIEAINEDNPMRIAEEIRNRNFHTVWGGVSAQLSANVSKQDPYTRMMYELMKKDIKVYTDSNGDTNIVSPDGSRKIIRKYQS